MHTPRDRQEWELMKALATHKLLLAQAHVAMAMERVKAAQADIERLGDKYIGSPFDAGAKVTYASADMAPHSKQALQSLHVPPTYVEATHGIPVPPLHVESTVRPFPTLNRSKPVEDESVAAKWGDTIEITPVKG